MIKKFIYGIAMCGMLASCSEDFTDWLNPQSNGQEDMKTAALAVTGTDPILMPEVTTDSVKVFSAELTAFERATATFDVVLSDPATGNKVDALASDAKGQVSTSELVSAVETLYGKRPVARTMNAIVSAYVSDGTQAMRKQGTVSTTVTLDAPVIEDAYYIIGSNNGWSQATVTDYKFTHSDKDVYEDPEFTITVTAPLTAEGERADLWFNIVPQSSLSLSGDDFWASLLGSANGNGDTSKEALIAKKVDGANNAFCQPASDGAVKYDITINMLEGTIKIVPGFGDPEVWYLLGNNVGDGTWSNGNVDNVGVSLVPMFPDKNTFQGLTGYSVLYYTGYFTNAEGFKLIKNIDSWDEQWGAKADGTLVKNDSGSGNIYVPADGYYTIKLDMFNDELTIEPYNGTPTVHSQMLITGDFDGWACNKQMSAVNTASCVAAHNHLWTYTIDASAGATTAKFLTDNTWAVNWGATDFPYGIGTQGGSNIPVSEGQWIVTFNDIDGSYLFTRK